MGFIQNQNLTLGYIQTDIPFREATTASSTVNSTIILLGMLTFGLQLCLVLFFMLRFWRLERRVQEVLKQTDSVKKLSVLTYCYPEVYKQNTYLLYNESSFESSAMEKYKDPTDYAYSPTVPWDLVQ